MPSHFELCMPHAREAYVTAEATMLTNVRVVHFRLENALAEMATRAAATERARLEA